MGTSVTFNGTAYEVPAIADASWGTAVSNYLIDIATGCLQKTGGAFTLSADVNFGASFGLLSPYFTSVTSSSSSAGVLRLAKTEVVGWRNTADGADLSLGIDSSDLLTWESVALVDISTAQTLTNKSMDGNNNTFTNIPGASITAPIAPEIGGTGIVNNSASTITITGSYGLTLTISALTALTLPTSGTVAVTANKLDAFAATTSAELAGVISDETGTGLLVFGTDPVLTTPNIGTPSAGTATNLTGLPIDGGTTGTLPLNRGGTGQTTANPAFNAISPLTTKGDVIGYSTVNARLGVGTNGQVLTADSGETTGLKWAAGGGGSGEINYILNPGGEDETTTGYAEYDDGASAVPVDGTGGTAANITFSNQASEILRGNRSFKIAKGAADAQGEGVSYDFSIKGQDVSKKLKIQFDFKTNEDAAYASGDWGVYIYDVTNTTLITPVDVNIIDGQNIYQTSFNSTDSLSYRLIFHCQTTNASAYDIYLDDIIVGPGMTSQGAAIGAWTAFTPTASWGDGFTGTGYWRRVGDSMELQYALEGTGTVTVGTGTLNLNMPAGYTMDSSLLDSNGWSQMGFGTFNDGGTTYYQLRARYADTSTFAIGYLNTANGADLNFSDTAPATWTSSDDAQIKITSVPIAEWAGSGIVPMLAEDNLSEWTAWTPTITGSGSNPTKGTTTETAYWRRVGDSMQIIYTYLQSVAGAAGSGSYEWELPNSLTVDNTIADAYDSNLGNAYAYDGTNEYIGYIIPRSSTSVGVIIYPTISTAANLGSGNVSLGNTTARINYNCTVPIAEWSGSQNSLVGYSLASATQTGLVSTAAQTFAGAKTLGGSITRVSKGDATPTGTGTADEYDDLLVGSDTTTNTGMSILSTGQGGLAFVDAASGIQGGIRYQHSSDKMEFVTAGAIPAVIDSAGLVGIGTTSPEKLVHIFRGESGGPAASSNATLVLEHSSHGFLQFLGAANVTQGIYFGDAASATSGEISYEHSGGKLVLYSEGVAGIQLKGDSKIEVETANWDTGGTAIGVSSEVLTTSPSSRRYKKNLRALDTEVDTSKIYDLVPYVFEYKIDNRKSFGLMAEDVEDIFPCLVHKEKQRRKKPKKNPNDKEEKQEKEEFGEAIPESVAYDHLSVLLLGEMKKLKAENTDLLERVSKLEKRDNNLAKRIAALETK